MACPPDCAARKTLDVTFTKDGIFSGVMFWYRLQLGSDDLMLDTGGLPEIPLLKLWVRANRHTCHSNNTEVAVMQASLPFSYLWWSYDLFYIEC